MYYFSVNPFMNKEADSVWYVYEPSYSRSKVEFNIGDPYYNKALPFTGKRLSNIKIFMATRNNKAEVLFIKPLSYFGALGEVGAYLGFLALIELALAYYHQTKFEQDLFNKQIVKSNHITDAPKLKEERAALV